MSKAVMTFQTEKSVRDQIANLAEDLDVSQGEIIRRSVEKYIGDVASETFRNLFDRLAEVFPDKGGRELSRITRMIMEQWPRQVVDHATEHLSDKKIKAWVALVESDQ
jgi:hypothetical protein